MNEPQTLVEGKPYQPAVMHTEPGYLQKRMEEYREKVEAERESHE